MTIFLMLILLLLLLLFVVLFNNVRHLRSENEKLRNWIEKIHCETKAMYEDFEEIEDKIKTLTNRKKKTTRGRKNGY